MTLEERAKALALLWIRAADQTEAAVDFLTQLRDAAREAEIEIINKFQELIDGLTPEVPAPQKAAIKDQLQTMRGKVAAKA